MYSQIRAMTPADREAVLAMMRVFYTSPAVLSDGSEEIYQADIDRCLSDSPDLEGYVFEQAGILQGYAMCSKSFATEFGRQCIWVEDLFILEAYRGSGIGSRFLQFIGQKYPEAITRLEVEMENQRAVFVYEKNGFRVLPYTQMKRPALRETDM